MSTTCRIGEWRCMRYRVHRRMSPVSASVLRHEEGCTAKVDVQRAGDTIVAAGSVPVTWTDFNVTPTDFAGFVTVEPTGAIEFLVTLAKK